MATAVSSFATAGGETVSDGAFTISRLSPWLYRLVEMDPYGQIPFMFAIVGDDKVVIVDTGTGAGGSELKSTIDRHINPGGLPYVVVCTHNHYDHVGGASGFEGHAICMGDKHKTYSQNLAITSLAAGVGASVRPFEVTRWLGDGAELFLDDAAPTPWNRLRVSHIPGHAMDHVAVYYERERRLFVGDTLYPFTAIDLANMGSNLEDYKATLGRIGALAAEVAELPLPEAPPGSPPHEAAGTGAARADARKENGETGAGGEGVAAPAVPAGEAATEGAAEAVERAAAGAKAVAEVEERMGAVKELLEAWLGLAPEDAAGQFDAWALLEASGWDIARAATTCQDYGEAIGEVAPPGSYALPKTAEDVRRQLGLEVTARAGADAARPRPDGGGGGGGSGGVAALARDLPAPARPSSPALTLACGHVDPALDAAAAVEEATFVIAAIQSGALQPSSVDTEYGSAEYRGSTLAFVLPHPLPAPKA